jgi:putative endonuclease
MFYCYILFSPTLNKFYIGHTGDHIDERIRKHNSNHNGFTGGKGDWQIVFFETFTDKKAAYAREREIKAWKSRIRIENLINGSI